MNYFDDASFLLPPNIVGANKVMAIKPDDFRGIGTFTRNSTATRVNQSDLIASVPMNTASIDWSTGYPVLNFEPAATNYFPYARVLSLNSWTSVGSFVEGLVISPEGLANATRVTTLNGGTRLQPSITGFNGNVCISVYVKRFTEDFTTQLNTFNSVDGSLFGATFNVTASGVSIAPYGSGYVDAGYILDSNGYYRIWATCQSKVGGSTLLQYRPATQSVPTTLDAYGVQGEVGNFPTSLMFSAGSAFTRNQATYSNSQLASCLGSQWTWYFEVEPFQGGNSISADMSIGIAGQARANFRTTPTGYRMHLSNINGISSYMGVATTVGTKFALSYDGLVYSLFIDGVLHSTVASVGDSPLVTLLINPLSAPIKLKGFMAMWSEAKDATFCNQLTSL